MKVCCSIHTAPYLFTETIHKQLKAEGVEGGEYKGSYSSDVCINMQCCQADERDPQQCSGTCKAADLWVARKDVGGMRKLVTPELTGTSVAEHCHKISTSCSVSVQMSVAPPMQDMQTVCKGASSTSCNVNNLPSCACGWTHCFENRLYTGSRQSSKRVGPTLLYNTLLNRVQAAPCKEWVSAMPSSIPTSVVAVSCHRQHGITLPLFVHQSMYGLEHPMLQSLH